MKSSLRSLLIVLSLAAGPAFAAVAPSARPVPERNVLTPEEKAAGWQLLFDGKSLAGWKASENKDCFSVHNGLLIVYGKRSHLFYDGPVANHDFKNFELTLDICTLQKANSGVYIHTAFQETGWPDKGYEVQVNNTHTDVKKGAGLYSIKDNLEAPAKDGEWYTMVVKVEGKRIQTFVNGKQIVDFTEPTPPAPPKNMAGRMLSRGTFALQGHDPDSTVLYRNIKVRVLP
jgi:hypothetical protein